MTKKYYSTVRRTLSGFLAVLMVFTLNSDRGSVASWAYDAVCGMVGPRRHAAAI